MAKRIDLCLGESIIVLEIDLMTALVNHHSFDYCRSSIVKHVCDQVRAARFPLSLLLLGFGGPVCCGGGSGASTMRKESKTIQRLQNVKGNKVPAVARS